jgi:hypothetical protein
MPTSVGPDGIDVTGLGWTPQSSLFNSNKSLESSAGPNSSLLNSAAQNGFLAWSMVPQDAISSFTVGTTSTNYLVRIYVPANGVSTKAGIVPHTNSANITGFYMGLYSSAGAQLAVTAESHSAIVTSGNDALYEPAWVSSVSVTGGQFYYVLVLTTWGTGAPTYAGCAGSSAASLNAGLAAAAGYSVSNGTATPPPASYTMSSNALLASAPWVAIL